MDFIFVHIVWLHAAMLILNTVFFIYAWEIRKMPGSRYFLVTLCSGNFWLLCQAAEICALSLETKLFLANLQYIAPLLCVTFFLLYVIELIKLDDKKQNRSLRWILIAVPFLFELLIIRFPWLVRHNVLLVYNGLYYSVAKDYGPLFWLMAGYNYACVAVSIVTLIFSLNEKPEIVKKQIILVIAAVCVPIIANIIQISGKSPFNLDFSPMAFGVCAMIITYGIAKFNLFKIIPVARSLVIKLMKAGMVVFDNSGSLLDINPAALKLLSLNEIPKAATRIEEVFAHVPQLIRIFDSHREQSSELSFEKNGINYYCEASLTAIKNNTGKEIAWLFQLYDITERKLAEDIIEQAAYHDPLTGLPNRQYFQLMLSQEITLAKMRGKKLSVAFLDLDNFKSINDGYGHEYGDALLKAVTRRLGGALREADLIARIGGDEFAIVIPAVSEKTEIAMMGERLLHVFKEEFDVLNLKISMRASIGFSIFPEDGDSNEILLRKADKAMYEVKKTGKNNFRTFN